MSSPLRPTEGARFLLERTAPCPSTDPGTRATYRAVIYTPDAERATTVVLVDDGTVELEAPTGAPAELDEMLVMLARLIARGAAKRRDDGLIVWPARLLRWRGPGR
ncbi:MAG: hypothetical protein H6Q90_3446 [Deltaproteobacteria bacterium]|nr:hypothetical protein [Deltaproteobacteria bacterium]